MSRTSLIVSTVLVVLAIIVILQNTGPVTTRILFIDIRMPVAILLLITLLLGVLLGMSREIFPVRRARR